MYINGSGTQSIAETLNNNNIPAPKGGIWRQQTVLEILKNEKYVGDLLMQKCYIVDHISKQQKQNRGELKKYLVSDNHEPIVDRETFNKVQNIFLEKNVQNPYVKAYDYSLKGMVFCNECGAKYMRKKTHTGTPSEHFVWNCTTYNKKGKKYCSNKQIPDDILCRLADGFDKEIKKIIICSGCKVRFIFEDGSEEVSHWEINRKWTDEMKQRNYYNQRRARG